MTGLGATKARMALLQAVADGAVTDQYPIGFEPPYAEWDHGPEHNHGRRYQTVTASIDKMRRAGWVYLDGKVHDGYKASRLFKLTALGREVLEATEWTP